MVTLNSGGLALLWPPDVARLELGRTDGFWQSNSLPTLAALTGMESNPSSITCSEKRRLHGTPCARMSSTVRG